ncbi:MAG: hypothetical protein M3155_08435 [Actinomycetota bacterium]|nr:hypothetical protein [Actinomycetota bacterium]
MRRKRYAIEDLRRAIDCLPVDTRVAMLDGVRSNDIIVGAYTDRSGGVCPMLAAHRCGGRTSLISFAHAWDRFAHAKRSRRATEREVRILTSHLEASVLSEHLPELEEVIVEHRDALERGAADHGSFRRSRRRPGDPDRASELAARPGWAWLRPFRRFDDYHRALERVEAEREALGATEPARERTPA